MPKKLLFFSLVLLASTVLASSLPSHSFIHATGEATLMVPANIAEIDFELTELTADPQLTLDTIVADSTDVFAYLAENHIAPEDIDAAEIKKFISQVEYADTPIGEKKYRLLRNFHLIVRDLQQWNSLVSGLLKKPYLGNFSVNFGRNDMDKIQDKLVMLATEDAKQNAQRLATGFSIRLAGVSGVSQTPLKAISTVLGLDGPVKRDVREELISLQKPTTRDFSLPAALKYKQNVEVIYKIKS